MTERLLWGSAAGPGVALWIEDSDEFDVWFAAEDAADWVQRNSIRKPTKEFLRSRVEWCCRHVVAEGGDPDVEEVYGRALDILTPWFAEMEAQSNSESTCEACPSPAVIQLSYTRWRCGECYEKFCDGRLTQYYEDLDRDRRDIALAPIARALGDPHGPIYGLDRVDCKWCGRPSMIESEYCSDECAHSDTDAECEHCELETRVGLLVGERLCDDCDAKEKLYERSYEEAAKSQEAAGLGPVTQSKSMAKSSSSGGSSMSTDTVRVRRVLDNAWIEYVTTEDVVLGLIGTHHGADIIPTIYPQGEGSVHLGKHETARGAETALLTEMVRRGWVVEGAPNPNPGDLYWVDCDGLARRLPGVLDGDS